jgi:hypothetical protein
MHTLVWFLLILEACASIHQRRNKLLNHRQEPVDVFEIPDVVPVSAIDLPSPDIANAGLPAGATVVTSNGVSATVFVPHRKKE